MIDPDTNEVWVDDLWTERPQFVHDCGGCVFQGTYKGFDLYTCMDSYIARYDNDGPDYLSSMTLGGFLEVMSLVETNRPRVKKPCPGCAEPCGQCDQEALD
jgi:hypothetical protein